MRSRTFTWFLFGLFLAGIFWVGSTVKSILADSAGTEFVMPQPSPTPEPASEESWLILPTMAPDATEADIGAEIYRLVCRDCHGDRGQGLTDAFRATWAPDDQNCWQAKCHAANHPPEGFLLPRFIPAIIGPNTLVRFESAAQLQTFISKNMPWHNPGSLTTDEYRQLTAYILRENQDHTALR